MAEHLSGVVERVTFHNPDTGFAVLRVQPRGRRGLVAVVGNAPSVAAGEQIEAVGAWVQDRDHGEQFKADQLTCTPPQSVEGVERYLGSGLVKGIGPRLAREIVKVFGERTLAVIDESPSFLREVKGIGPRRIQRIREGWRQHKAVRDIMVFLQSHGVGTARAVRIYKTYGDQAVAIVRANPYWLAADIWGVGFKTADELAQRLGCDPQSPQRARAALRFLLQRLSQEGHVGYPEPALLDPALLRDKAGVADVPAELLAAAVEAERQAGEMVRETEAAPPLLYLKPLFLAELGVARSLLRLREGDHPLPPPAGGGGWGTAVRAVESRMGLELAAAQRDAVAAAARNKVLVVTGGPGVGKTTIVRGILGIFSGRGLRCALCAPTGRAAKRLTETTGREAKTIHRLLEFDPALGGFRRDAANPLDLDLLVVDEASMVDVVLMHQLTRAVPARACLVLVGDVDQLPSVGPGTVLADVIASGAVPVVRLTEVFRQAGQSCIVRAAHAVRRGEIPESAAPGQGDFYFVEADEPAAILDRIVTMVRQRIPQRFGLDPFRDVQVLTPMNRTELGAHALNIRLQAVLNPPTGGPEIERFGWKFRVGDKVLQTHNDYQKEVFNGDLGRIAAIDETEREIVVDFDGKRVPYDFGELDEISLAYALTIHKAQGSEYPAVVLPLHTQHFLMLQRNLLYTGLTRGKRLVVLVGARKALETAVRRQDTMRRCSRL
ncbi:MAG TPA: ATP-dependent RecD-like DNA helicase, partial [Gemmataceae bacterium]|nr:ATP-dependent RecD-like DNA helicase [Gemmataceae bacterium]